MSDLDKMTGETQSQLMRTLAREVATDILPLETILETYGISPKQYENISNNRAYKAYLQEAVEAWASAENATGRAKLKLAIAAEESIPEMMTRLHDQQWPAPARVELFKTFLKAAGLASIEGEGGNTSERVQININMSSASEPVTIDRNLRIDREGAVDVD